jgi:hypothetical protein
MKMVILSRSPDGINNWGDTVALDANVTGYTDFSLLPDTTSFYRVYAYNNAANSNYSNVAAAPVNGVLNFYDFSVDSYAGGQDKIGTVTIENGGTALNLTGNRWQQIAFSYTITPDTVLEFDFHSARQVDIHAIGFDDDLFTSRDRVIQLYGSRTWGIQDFNNHPDGGDVQHYRIEIGKFYTGDMQYLFLIMNHDVRKPTGNNVFSNIRVYEDTN